MVSYNIPSERYWKDLKRRTWYPFTFGGGPLQIMVGNGDFLYLQLRTPSDPDSRNWKSIQLKFSTGEYYIRGCMTAMEKLSSQAANIMNTSTVWTIDLKEDRLHILADSLEIKEVLFHENSWCSRAWKDKSLSFGEIKFPVQDEVSLRFRHLDVPASRKITF